MIADRLLFFLLWYRTLRCGQTKGQMRKDANGWNDTDGRSSVVPC